MSIRDLRRQLSISVATTPSTELTDIDQGLAGAAQTTDISKTRLTSAVEFTEDLTSTPAQLDAAVALVGTTQKVYNVKKYGAKGDGTTDDSDAVLAAIAAADAAGGGTIYFPVGTYVITKRITIPYTGTAHNERSHPFRFTGETPNHTFQPYDRPPLGGSRLDLRTVDAVAKIWLVSKGSFEMDNLLVMDTTDGTSHFFINTYTTVYIHDCQFWGKTIWPTTAEMTDKPLQDVFWLGGPTATSLAEVNNDNNVGPQNYWWQGNNGRIVHCSFNQIRRAVYARMTTNGFYFTNNTIFPDCGYDGGVIEADSAWTGGPYFLSNGNCITDNLIELRGYDYGIKLQGATGWVMSGNAFWDAGDGTNGANTTLACVYFGTHAKNNIFTSGYRQSTALTWFTDANFAAATEPNVKITPSGVQGLFGSLSFSDAYSIDSTLTGSAKKGITSIDAGSLITWSQSDRGPGYKRVIVRLLGGATIGTGSYIDYTTAFSSVPTIITGTAGVANTPLTMTVLTTTTTRLSLECTDQTGWIIVEGY